MADGEKVYNSPIIPVLSGRPTVASRETRVSDFRTRQEKKIDNFGSVVSAISSVPHHSQLQRKSASSVDNKQR